MKEQIVVWMSTKDQMVHLGMEELIYAEGQVPL